MAIYSGHNDEEFGIPSCRGVAVALISFVIVLLGTGTYFRAIVAIGIGGVVLSLRRSRSALVPWVCLSPDFGRSSFQIPTRRRVAFEDGQQDEPAITAGATRAFLGGWEMPNANAGPSTASFAKARTTSLRMIRFCVRWRSL